MWLRCLVSWSQTGTWWNFPANRISRVVVTGIDRKLLDTSHQARRDHQDRPWRLLESQHRKLTILSPPRLKYSSNNENTSIKSTAFWLSVWKKWCLEKGIAKEIENYEPTQLTLCSSDPMPKLKQTSLNLGNDDSISSKVIRTWLRLSNYLELFSRTLNFFAPWRCEDITAYYFLDRTRLFWPNARFEQTILALDARALLMLNYDKPSRIFSCLLLTRNHMIFLVQFEINKHLLIFSKTTNCIRSTGSYNIVNL